MIFENALIFKVLTRLKLNKVYLLVWRKSVFRKIINSRRIILFKLNKLPNNIVASRISADLARYGIAKAVITEFRNMPNIVELQNEYDELLSKDNLSPHDRKAKSFIQRLVDDDYKFDSAQSAISFSELASRLQ